jgi:hypothetical protein
VTSATYAERRCFAAATAFRFNHAAPRADGRLMSTLSWTRCPSRFLRSQVPATRDPVVMSGPGRSRACC